MKTTFVQQNKMNTHIYVLVLRMVLSAKKLCFFALLALALFLPALSFAATTGAKVPTLGSTAAESPWLDNDWTTPTNIYSDNAATANVTAATFDSPDQTYVLKATGFDFSAIPDGSTINGVTVRVNAWYRSGQGSGSIDLCQLLDTSRAKVGTNLCSTPTALTTTDTTVITYGGSSNLWGNTLTTAWLKDADFGVALGILATAANADVDIDYVTIEVDYTLPPFRVSGMLFTDEGDTALTTSKTIKLMVGTSTPSIHTTTTDTNGYWQIEMPTTNLTAGKVITAWVDGDSATRASATTKLVDAGVTYISDLDLYKNHVIVRQEDFNATTTTNAQMGTYDGDNDADIMFRASGSNLTVNAHNELYVQGSTYAPGGTVTVSGNGSSTSATDGSLELAKYFERFDVSGAAYASKSKSVTSQDTGPRSVVFSTDGSKMYMVGLTNDAVYQYNLGTPWDVSTASYASKSFSTASQATTPISLAISSDGTKVYVSNSTGATVYQYTLSTPWDASTGTYASKSYSHTTQDSSPGGITWSTDGTKMFVAGLATGRVYQYTIATPWDVSTASYASKNVLVNTQDGSPYGLALSPDGRTMFISGDTNNRIYQYTLSTAWDVGTASYASKSLLVSGQDTSPLGVTLSGDGSQIYIMGNLNDTVYQYEVQSTASTLDATSAVTLAGSFINAASHAFSNTSTLTFNATTTGKTITSAGDELGNVTFSGAGTWTFNDVATTTDLTIGSGGTVVAPSTLTIYDDYSNSGTFTAGSGSVNVTNEASSVSTWDVSTAAVLGSTFSVASQETLPDGIVFNPDGTKMYVMGWTGNSVRQYALSSAWDITTAVYSEGFSVQAQDDFPDEIEFSSDGLVMYVLGQNNDRVYQYTLSSAWNVSSATLDTSFSVTAKETSPTGLAFKTDGTKMYVMGFDSDSVHQYGLSTPWDVDTAAFESSLNTSAVSANSESIYISPDGTKFFFLSSFTVYSYTLGTPWSVTSGTYDSLSKAVVSDSYGLTFGDEGKYMYVTSDATDSITRYELDLEASVTEVTSTLSGTMTGTSAFNDVEVVAGVSKEVAFSNNASTSAFTIGSTATVTAPSLLTVTGDFANNGNFTAGSGNIYFEEGTGYDVSTASFVDSFSVASQDTQPNDVAFSANGLKMFVVGFTGQDINEYTLSIAFDVSTASFVDSFSVASQEAYPSSLSFSSNGLKMFVVGEAGDDVNEYTLGTAFDVSTASFVDSFSVASQETQPYGLAFSANGLKMFVAGASGDDVNEYTLGTAFDVSTASFVDSFSVASQDTQPTDVAFSANGLKMFVLGNTGDDVSEYTLGTAFDVSTASFVDSFSVASQETDLWGFAFSNDGLKMFLTGTVGDDVNEYTLDGTQELSGNLTGSDALHNVFININGTTTIANNASTTDLTVVAAGTALVAPTLLTISDDYTNNGTFNHSDGTVYFNGAVAQTLAGGMVGDSTLNDVVFSGASTKTFSNNASSSSMTIGSGSTVVAPSALSLNGAFTNSGTFTSGSGTIYLGESSTEITTIEDAYDVTAGIFDMSFSVASQELNPTGVFFSSDGLKMYVIGYDGNDVNQYALTDAWEISTAAVSGTPFSATGQDDFFEDLHFSSDGTKMYLLGSGNDDVFSYTLSTAWDVTTASYDSASFAIAQDISAFDMAFSTDGSKMYILGDTNDRVYAYTLGTPWNISTVTYDSVSFLVSGQETSNEALAFSPDGTKMYVAGAAGDDINPYTLSTPWLVSSATFDGAPFSVAAKDTYPTGLAFDEDGYRLFVVGQSADQVHTYLLGVATTSSTGATTLTGNLSGTSALNDVSIDSPQGINLNGTTWSPQNESEDSTWNAIAYGNGTFVAVAYSGTNRVMTSPDGITWTSQSASQANSWNAITYGEGLFVAVSGNGTNQVMTSPDGVSWDNRTAGAANEWYSVTYGGGQFVAVAHNNFAGSATCTVSCVMTSPDGITWSPQNAAAANKWEKVVYGDGLYVAVASTGTDLVMTSTDGIAWVSRNTPGSSLYGLAYGNGLFVAVAFDFVVTSPNGINWTTLTTNYDANGWQSVRFGGGLFVAVAPDGTNRVMTSPDGKNWTPRAAGAANKWWDVIYGENKFVAVAQQTDAGATCTTSCVMTSSGGDSYGEVTFANNASTTDLTISSVSHVVAPTLMSIAGNYTNDGAIEWGTGTTTFNGTILQVATGTMTGTDSFSNVQVLNTTATTSFKTALTVDNQFSATSSAIIEFPAGATTTVDSFYVLGSQDSEVVLRSTVGGTRWGLDATTHSVGYVDVKDSNACSGAGNITAASSTDSGNNLCWTITAAELSLTIAGTLFSDEGTTPITSGETIKLAVGTSTPGIFTTTSDGSGDWSIEFSNSGVSATTPFVVWVDADATTRASAVTVASSSNESIAGIDLYEDRVIVRHESGSASASTTNAHMGVYDGDDDADIRYAVSEPRGFGIEDAVYDSNFSVAGQETTPLGLAFSTDGLKMFVTGETGDDVNEYTLSSAFDVSTAAFVDSFSVALQETSPRGLAFSTNGLKMFVLGQGTRTVHEYTLGAAFDVSTASYVDGFLVDHDGGVTGLSFSANGRTMYMIGASADAIYQYQLAVAWDVSTADVGVDSDIFSVADQETLPYGLAFTPNGHKMFVIGQTSDRVHAYTLPIAFDVRTASYAYNISISSNSINPADFEFSPDGSKMFIVGTSDDQVDEYILPTGYSDLSVRAGNELHVWNNSHYNPVGTVVLNGNAGGALDGSLHVDNGATTTITDVVTIAGNFAIDTNASYINETRNDTIFTATTTGKTLAGNLDDIGDVAFGGVGGAWTFSSNATTSAFNIATGTVTGPAGVLAIGGDYANSGTATYSGETRVVAAAFETQTAAFVDAFSIAAQETSPRSIVFSTNGLKMFVLGSVGDDVNEYTLSSAFNLSTASFVDAFSIAAQETTPHGLAFSSNGLKMFVSGQIGDDVNEYTLSSAWDVSTASFVDSFSVAAQDITPNGVTFSSNGLKMFVVGDTGDDINEYTLGGAFDVSTASFVDSFSVASEEASPYSVLFTPDGFNMFVMGIGGDDVNRYILTTAFDVSTASYVDSFSVVTEETSPYGLAFSSDGLKMFMTGGTGQDVSEYTLAHSFSGSMIGSNDFVDFSVADDGAVAFANNASTTDFISSGLVEAPSQLSVAGNFGNTGMYRHNRGTVYLSGASKTVTGDVTNGNEFYGSYVSGTRTFGVAASTTDLTIGTGATLTINGNLTITDDYQNNGTQTITTAKVYADTDSYSVPTASFVDSFSFATQDINPYGLAFSSNGLKMFVVGQTGDAVYEYTLGTAHDVSTASYVDSFSVAAQEITPSGLAFSSNGLKMFVLGAAGDDVNEYTLGAAFDVSTATFVDSFSVVGQDNNPYSLQFSSDGLKMFIVGTVDDDVLEYTLSAAWDVSTATFVDSFSAVALDAGLGGLAFSADGLKMFVAGIVSDYVYEHALAVAWDVSTAVYTTKKLSVAAQENGPSSLAFSQDGSNLYVLGVGSDSANQYDLSHSFAGTMTGDSAFGDFIVNGDGGFVFEDAATVSNFEVLEDTAVITLPTTFTVEGDLTNNGTLDSTAATTTVFVGPEPYTLASKTFVDSFSIAAQEVLAYSVEFSTDGLKMFVMGDIGDDVNEYTLRVPFDVSTASYVDSFSVASQESEVRGLAFSRDGLKMFVTGWSGDDVNEYTLTTAFDVSTASFVDSFSVAAQDGGPSSLEFSTDGLKMFIVGFAGLDIGEYTLGTPWDVSTASYVDALAVSAVDTSPQGLAFSEDGLTMFLVGDTGNDVNRYDLSTAWDISTASHDTSFSVATEETTPTGIAFSKTGDKMFILGFAGDDVNEYWLTGNVQGSQTLSGNFTLDSAFYDLRVSNASSTIISDDLDTTNLYLGVGTTTLAANKTLAVEGDFVKSNKFVTSTSTVFIGPAGYRLDEAVYSGKSKSVNAQDAIPLKSALSSDGTKMYILGAINDTVYQYTLSTAWDVSTASYASKSFSVTSQESSPYALKFSSDGTKMYVLGTANDTVYQYTLSTAWDVSTASYASKSFSVTTQDNAPGGLIFNPEGTKVYVVGNDTDTVYQYTLSTAWDVSTASYASKSFSVASQETTPYGIAFSRGGSYMLILGITNDTVYQYTLSTPYDVSTASYASKSFSVNSQESAPGELTLSGDGSKMYVVGSVNDTVYEYYLATSSLTSTRIVAGDFSGVSAFDDIIFSANGTTSISGEITADDVVIGGGVVQGPAEMSIVGDYTNAGRFDAQASSTVYFGPVSYDISTAIFDEVALSVVGQEISPTSMLFNDTGTILYVMGQTGDDINAYPLGTPYDISSYTSGTSVVLSVAGQELSPLAMLFNDTGTILYVMGQTGDDINAYPLGTPYDISSYTSGTSIVLSVAGQETLPYGMRFNNMGTILYVMGANDDDINAYPLPTPYDISSYTSGTSIVLLVAAQDLTPTALLFNDTGTVLYVMGATGDDINAYTLPTEVPKRQIISGNLSGTSAFENVTVTNTSGTGSSTQSVWFASPIEVVKTYTMLASTSAAFPAGATSTILNFNLRGTEDQNVYLRSTNLGDQWGLDVSGTQYVEYVDVRDSNACDGDTITSAGGTNIDSGNNDCWSFPVLTDPTFTSGINQRFTVAQATTTIGTITITEDAGTPSVLAANDLRIVIATSTLHMKWDTTDTAATFGGTASGKVSGTVSYEGGGSILVIDVTENFAASDTLTIGGLSYAQFTAPSVATSLQLRTDGASDTTSNATDPTTITITGTLTVANHDEGQVESTFAFQNKTDTSLFAFKLTPAYESSTIGTLTFSLSGIRRIDSEKLSNLKLYRDHDADGLYDATDEQIGGAGVLSIAGQSGTITFSTPWTATTSQNYILTGNTTNTKPNEYVTISLNTYGSVLGVISSGTITPSGSVSSVQHIRGGNGGEGAQDEIGGGAPAGDGDVGGGEQGGGGGIGEEDNGEQLGSLPGFQPPTVSGGEEFNEWQNGSNALVSDSTYATAASGNLRQSYSVFGFNVPGTNTVQGIEVKLEASATGGAGGTIQVVLSWNGEQGVTATKATSVLTTSDVVYTLGGPSDTWGRSWTPAELSNANFFVRVVAQPEGNTVRVDALQVRPYHQASGGGGGGGDEI